MSLSMKYDTQVLMATMVWWSVFYSPGDLFYTMVKNKLVYVPICVVKEIYRGKKVLGGMKDAGIDQFLRKPRD